jgi:creatinine amidohydrolase
MLPTRFWAEMVTTDFTSANMEEVIAVLPVAAVEQHGPHLPLGVDTFIMEDIIRRTVPLLPPDLPVLFLPINPIGCSIEHRDFPGTLSISAETLIKAWTELGYSVHRAGCRKLVLANTHGGNVAMLDIIAHDLRARLGLFTVLASLPRFGAPEGLFTSFEARHGIHGGDIETSIMLSARPDLVRMKEAQNFASLSEEMERDFTLLRSGRPTGFGWMAQDLSATGAMGDATAATAAKGEAAAAHVASAFVTLLQEIARFDLSKLK